MSKALIQVEERYTLIEKMVLALQMAMKTLYPYF